MSKKKEYLELFKEMYDNIDKLPVEGKMSAVNHYDLMSLLLLLIAWSEEDLKDES